MGGCSCANILCAARHFSVEAGSVSMHARYFEKTQKHARQPETRAGSRRIRFHARTLAIATIAGTAAKASMHSRLRQTPHPQTNSGGTSWQFTVSGDSRNCGDVVMPAIAADALKHQPSFYWHLGDFRATYTFDEDILHQPQLLGGRRQFTRTNILRGRISWSINSFRSANFPFSWELAITKPSRRKLARN